METLKFRIYETLQVAVIVALIGIYVNGAYAMITQDKYAAKDVVFGMVAAPYAMYIGVKELLYTLSSIKKEDRTEEFMKRFHEKKISFEELEQMISR